MSGLLNLIVAVAVLILIAPDQGHAQASRTWVSGVGDDAFSCVRTAPCKTFANAMSKTAAGGEISVLDPGGFGAVRITKSLSIVAEGVAGSILANSINAIVIDAGPNDQINLHGLTLEGAGTGIAGIRVLSAGSVNIRKCLIRGFQNATGGAILVDPGPTMKVLVSECTLVKNTLGVRATAPGGGGFAHVVLDRVNIDSNATFGIRAVGANSTVFMNNSIITGNATGLSAVNNATISSLATMPS